MAKKLKAIIFAMVMLLTMCVAPGMASAEETEKTALDKLLVIYNMNSKTQDNVTYYPIHVYAGIDSLQYAKVGFEVRAVNKNTDATQSKSTRVVYTSMNVTNSSGEVTAYSAADLGGVYMFGQELLFTAGNWFNADATIYVTPYAQKLDGNKLTGRTITLTDEVIRNINPASNLFKEIEIDAGDSGENPGIVIGELIASGTTAVTPTEDSKVSGDGISIDADTISADLPAGVTLEEGATELTLSLTALENSQSSIEAGENAALAAYDVNIAGVAKENDVPIIVTIDGIAQNGLNSGNIQVYHVESDGTKEMTEVDNPEDLTAHNQFAYNETTGTLTLALASFSEVSVVADTEPVWQGKEDTEFTGSGKEDDPYIISNADELVGLAKLVSEQNSTYGGAYYKLNADVNIGGTETWNTHKKVFYPIGYYKKAVDTDGVTPLKNKAGKAYYTYGGAFSGTFDGDGHTISGIYQNTWVMDGDYDNGYYNDAMGLFGYISGGTVKNLTIDNFYSEGEFAPTGCIAAYADGTATFENIALTNCHPQTYNTGVAGIVGWDNGGDKADLSDQSIYTFKNITVDDTNIVSALWGSWDVAAAGIMGYLGEYSTANLINCNVAATIDVYNDVCGNYQYYWYRYCGMMIGTVDKTKTDGSLDLSNITATDCTANFGDRHEYYYCEFVKNSKASYTHDYQFSRVPHAELNLGVSPVTCTHDHTTSGYETTDIDGDGVIDSDVLLEDKQAVYIPFWQLFGGYGWGVDGVDLDEYVDKDGKQYIDISVVSRSEEKFKLVADAAKEYITGTTIPVADLFKAIEGKEKDINTDSVYVSATALDDGDDETDTNPVSIEYTLNTEDWTQSKITFSGVGSVKLTIQDYDYCKTTEVELAIKPFDFVPKFENTDDYLYRVGNKNTVALGSLFEALNDVEIDSSTVSVAVENSEGDATGTYTANATGWKQGTIQFSGTGVVTVTIQEQYSNPLALKLEVVDGYNVTQYSELGNRNSVLLADITMSSGSSYSLSGATLYGNGFTFDVTAGAYTSGGNLSSNYVVCLVNAQLDNVKIIGDVYTSYGATVKADYNRSTVLSSGNSVIANSYISNCAAPVRVNGGNLEIINTTLKGGNFANLDIRGGHVILDNVTTINQVNSNDTASDGTTVVGLGVVVYYENVLSTTTVEVKNGITQYNHLSKTEANKYIQDDTAKQLTAVMFGSDCSAVQYTDSTGEVWVNTGIMSMTEAVGNDGISDVDGYSEAFPELTGVTGYVHAKQPDATSIAETAPAYATAGQYAIAPGYSFDYTTKNYQAKTDGSNDYCYEENGTVNLSMDAGDTVNWDTSILTVTKNGQTLDYTVSMDGTDYTGKTIPFSTKGNYAVDYKYTDSNNYGVDTEGNITTYKKTYTKTVHISVSAVEASAKKAEFMLGSSNAATEKITVDNVTYISATGVTADNSTWTYMTVGDEKIYYPIIAAKLTSTKGSSSYAYFPVFENAVTITDYADNGTGTAFTYNSSTTTLPSTLTAVKGIYKAASDVTSWSNLTNSNLTQSGASNIFKWASSSSAESTPTTYNNVLCYKSPQISADRVAYITLVQYSYTDATNTTYYYYVGYTLEAFTKQTTCVTGDTLIPLVDGTQKRIDAVTYDDMLKVWDFEKGEYTTAPAAVIRNHGFADNTVISLQFSDGTVTKAVNEHGYYDAELQKFVAINGDNAKDYIGHSFVKETASGYQTVILENVTVENEYVEAWSLLADYHYNFIADGILSISSSARGLEYFMPFTYGADLKIDAEKMQADIEKYGLYTYEEFEDILTPEQFRALNMPQIKVAVGKGIISWDDLMEILKIEVLEQ